ncbi:MAG TPA: hybrid sensor histidine kinase/response regulator [Kofleriaceae bacterium]|jgi:signal transduction histidine kinase
MTVTARILVVDDDDHVREALVDELSPRYTVEAVGSGLEAMDRLALHPYDVVISDLKMPDRDGIEVLEFARTQQADAVRVLLTGYLDERAHQALLSPDAPYKVGKPWHDEIEIVVRRGLEQRERQRALFASVDDALRLASFDDELAATQTAIELAELMVRRGLTTDGVTACATIARVDGEEHPFRGSPVPPVGVGWYLDLPLDFEGSLRLRARGDTSTAQRLVAYMAHRAQRRFGILEARVSLREVAGSGSRMHLLMRQATLGALTSAMLHDLASTLQTLGSALSDMRDVAAAVPELAECINEASLAGTAAVQLFVQMRKLIRDGEVERRELTIAQIVQRSQRLVGSYVRERATLQIAPLPDVKVSVSESLFAHVLVNLLRNAANVSPAGGKVDFEVKVVEDGVAFIVTDDGPGVSPEIADYMFEPFATNTRGGTGLGLAIAAYVMHMLDGRITYHRDPVRGACFTATLPR